MVNITIIARVQRNGNRIHIPVQFRQFLKPKMFVQIIPIDIEEIKCSSDSNL